MELHEQHLEDIREIRSIMERSSRFISLSGLSGIFAGLYALAGAFAVWIYAGSRPSVKSALNSAFSLNDYRLYISMEKSSFVFFLIALATVILILAVGTGIFLTTRQAKKKGQSIWDSASQKLIINLAIPLITGGLFCLILLYHGLIGLVAPATLLFYGLALINGSKYTLTDIRYLGFCEIALGLLSMLFIGYGLLFWSIGFGVMHIIYGTKMYFKYER